MDFSTRARGALVGSLLSALLPAAAMAQDMNAVVSIGVGDDDGANGWLQPSPRRSWQWQTSGALGEWASAWFATKGAARTGTYALSKVYNGVPMRSGSVADMWVADMITLQVPGAAPDQRTRIKFRMGLSGEISATDQNRVGGVSVEYCLGLDELGQACGDLIPPNPYGDYLQLGPASGVRAGHHGKLEAWEGPNVVDLDESFAVVIQGHTAVLPVWFLLGSRSHTITIEPGDVSASSASKWSMKLPMGVTCTSRSGQAFWKTCPRKAAMAP
jgi:hypothetical protein